MNSVSSPHAHCLKCKVLVFLSVVWLVGCSTVVPTTETGEGIENLSYTDPIKSGLIADQPFPESGDVCVSLLSNLKTKELEKQNHILIACPKHELGAIEDRKSQQKAQVVDDGSHWVVMRVPMDSATSI